MKKVLAVLEKGEKAPSGFVRSTIYKSRLLDNGYKFDFFNYFPEENGYKEIFLRKLYRRFLKPSNVDSRRLQKVKLGILEKLKEYDFLYLNKVFDIELVKNAKALGKKIHLDFVDSMWLYQDSNEEFNEVLKLVNLVTTDNPQILEYILKHNSNALLVPDPPQVELFDKFRIIRKKTSNCKVRIGWIGSESTAYNLFEVWKALEFLFNKNLNIELVLVGVGNNKLVIPPFENVRPILVPYYDQTQMIDEVLKMDIGLFPLQDVEKCRTRGILKACIYMSGGAAVIASPVGQIANFISNGSNGYLAKDTKDWINTIFKLVCDPNLRRNIAEIGLKEMRNNFSVDSTFASLKAALQSLD